MRSRRVLLLLLLLPACVGFHPRTPPAGAANAATADANAPGAAAVWLPQWRAIGESRKGRPLRVTTVGHGPRRVLWIGGIHGDEREGRIATAELPRAFLATPGAAELVTLTILEDVNPDGTAQNTRGNAVGVDLNRNYPAGNFVANRFHGGRPLDQPEARALHDYISSELPHLVIVAHSWRGDHFINYDGPAERLAERFSQLSGYRVQPSEGIRGTPGSLGSWVGGKLGLPILTLEYLRGRDPWDAWIETKAAILAVVLAE